MQVLHAGRPFIAEVAPAGGAGQQITLQAERAEDAAPHAVQDDREIVGADDGSDGGEFRGGDAG